VKNLYKLNKFKYLLRHKLRINKLTQKYNISLALILTIIIGTTD